MRRAADQAGPGAGGGRPPEPLGRRTGQQAALPRVLRVLRVLLAVLVLCAAAADASRRPTAAAAAPPVRAASVPAAAAAASAPAVYWGAYTSGVPWDMSLQDTLEAQAGKGASVIHWGQPWWHGGAYQPFYPSDFERVRLRGSIPMIDWASWDYCCGTDQPTFALAAIARGDHDAYIRSWARSAAAWGHPFFLRFDWEMNGSWQFPWHTAQPTAGNTAADYVAAWRHVHELFVAEGATNATWVWCPNVVDPNTTPLAALYPGDAYVDWTGLDGYNFGTDPGNSWRSFDTIFAASEAEVGRLAPTKPLLLGEFASSESGGDKAAWIADALGVQVPQRYPRIRAVVWFNWNDNDPGRSWPVASSSASVAAFGSAIGGSPVYVANTVDSLPLRAPVPVPGGTATATTTPRPATATATARPATVTATTTPTRTPAPAALLARWNGDSLPRTAPGNGVVTGNVNVTNAGTAAWQQGGATPVHLAYHWLDASGSVVVWDGARTTLYAAVAPGATTTLQTTVVVPATPGSYTLILDLVEEGVTWFGQQPGAGGVPTAPGPSPADRIAFTVTPPVTPTLAASWGAVTVPAAMAAGAIDASGATTVTNAGSAAWASGGANPVLLSYHWYDARRGLVTYDGLRTVLPGDVAQGGTVTIPGVRVRAPATAGTYTLTLDLVQEGVAWFSQRGSNTADAAVTIR